MTECRHGHADCWFVAYQTDQVKKEGAVCRFSMQCAGWLWMSEDHSGMRIAPMCMGVEAFQCLMMEEQSAIVLAGGQMHLAIPAAPDHRCLVESFPVPAKS